MTVQLITAAASNHLSPRWLTGKIAMGLWQQCLFDNRSDVDSSLSREGLPAMAISFPDGLGGHREFLITVEEL